MGDTNSVLGIGSGLARGLASVFLNKRQQDDQLAAQREQRTAQNALDAAHYLISSGRVADYSEVQSLFDLALGTGGKKGKAGALDPHAILSQVLSPALATAGASASGASSFPVGADDSGNLPDGSAPPVAPAAAAPTAPATPTPTPARQRLLGVSLLSDDEMATRGANAAAIADRAKTLRQVQTARELYAQFKDLDPDFTLRDALRGAGFQIDTTRQFQPKALGKPITADDLPDDATDEQGQKIDPTKAGFWQPIQGAKGNIYYTPGAAPSTAAFKLPPGDAGQFMATALMSLGVPDATKATPEQVAKALPIASKAASEKLSDADGLRHVMQSLHDLQAQNLQIQLADLPTADDLQENARTITLDGTPYAFVSKGDYSGARAQNAAEAASKKAGVLVVTPQEAAQLSAAQATMTNLNAFFDQIKSKLPADAANRPLTGVKNKLSQYFQTDDQLASVVSWDLEVVPMLRSLLVNNRITNTEFNRALVARPTITDTVGAATQKLDNLQTIIKNSVSPILKRGTGAKAAGAAPATAPTPTTTTAAQRNRARQALLASGYTADDASIDQLLKNNPATFK